MSKNASSVSLHLCETRAPIPGGSQQERERDYAETLHREGPFLIKSELERIRPVELSPNNLLNRIFQAFDVLLGRRNVYVERRRH
jgi:aminoglycoside N3'-acetyltransferase